MNDTFYKKYPPVFSVDNEEGLVFAIKNPFSVIFLFWNGALSAASKKTSNKCLCN